MRRRHKVLFTIGVMITLILGVGTGYVLDGYSATPTAQEYLQPSEEVRVNQSDDYTHFAPIEEDIVEDAATGIIFYPGGKVDPDAYAPLLNQLAQEGYHVFLIEMPLDLAVLNINAADAIIQEYDGIEDWYIAGHSLGGSMAASYSSNHSEKIQGLILLAAYSTADLTDTQLDVLSIVATEDEVLNEESYMDNLANLPEDYQELVIEGGNHSQFGSYGQQSGDGASSISPEEQWEAIVEGIHEFISSTE